MKKKREEQSHSVARIAFTSCLFVAICFLCFFTSVNQINLHHVMKQSASALFFTNNLQMPPAACDTSEAQNPSSPPPAFRLLIGILTRPDQYRLRNLLRLVYRTQMPVAAEIDVKFVFCNLNKDDQKTLVALEIMYYDDIIILNCTENMNNGKTYTYFSSLSYMFSGTRNSSGSSSRPYDYVMKADDDIYIRLGPLVEALNPLPREDLYYGFTIPCREMNPVNHYMSGMGYVLSWDLVEWIQSSDIPKNHTDGPEDKVLGEWLQMGARGKNRYNAKPAMYDYPIDVERNKCERELSPDTIAVHRLKSQEKWIKTLRYFNATQRLKPSRFYHVPQSLGDYIHPYSFN
ncbi:beta-1,3-galactosyltransferase pvg3-like [Aristolochia californica]|uniref:beta-1,3-galactosyltransferase pvg3-like n=1 Tax=Aristolochia californica TaxID=171875 RepID=UPI0035DE1E45